MLISFFHFSSSTYFLFLTHSSLLRLFTRIPLDERQDASSPPSLKQGQLLFFLMLLVSCCCSSDVVCDAAAGAGDAAAAIVVGVVVNTEMQLYAGVVSTLLVFVMLLHDKQSAGCAMCVCVIRTGAYE